MKTVNEKLEQWAIRKVEAEYPSDVCLLLEHRHLRLDKDCDKIGLGSYVPHTARSNGLARTFIIDGIGYDLFPQTWERFERMADVDHYNLTCLDHGTVLWARTEADRQRFESLQAKLRANLNNPSLMLERAQKWLNAATELFADILFEDRAHLVRENVGYICDLLAIAVAYTNGTYFHRGQNGQLDELRKLAVVPTGFINLYSEALFEKNPDVQKKLVHSLLRSVREHLNSFADDTRRSKGDIAELADWYHELSYTWRRVYHYCEVGDAATAYLWGCMLQKELGVVAEEYDAPYTDILSAFDADNLAPFAECAAKSEGDVAAAFKAGGGKLDVYATVDEFLEKNK